MGIFLRGNCESRSHAGFALGLRVRQMSLAVLVDEVVLAGKGRDAPLTRFLMRTIHAQSLKIMAEFFITDQPLTFFAFFIVRMTTYI